MFPWHRGQITDSVRCDANKRFCYSLYLPENYNDKTKWPVLFVFDPGARSHMAVQRFVPAAEKYGYIVVCSPNSRNGLAWNETADLTNCMFGDVMKKFSTDASRIYTAGFSGGSRVASALAMMYKGISGVIACGAGLAVNPSGGNLPAFDMIGLVGCNDMNYSEMCELERIMENAGKKLELRVFEGRHEWPDPKLLEGAVGWLDMQAVRKGTIKRGNDFIELMVNHAFSAAKESLKSGDLVEAARRYKYIPKDFPDDPRTVKAIKTLDSLKLTKDYSRAVKKCNAVMERETSERDYLGTLLMNRVESGKANDSTSLRISDRLGYFRRMEKDNDPYTRAMAYRVMSFMSLVCYERGSNFYSVGKYREASICFETGMLAEPDNMQMLIFQAKACALDNNASEALACLKKAVDKGFKDRELLMKDKAFAGLRNDGRFRRIIELL